MTCCTCTNHYSVKFTDGSDSNMTQSGNHYIYEIGIDDATNANDLVNKIITGMDGGQPNGHYTKLVTTANGVLTVYDERANH